MDESRSYNYYVRKYAAFIILQKIRKGRIMTLPEFIVINFEEDHDICDPFVDYQKFEDGFFEALQNYEPDEMIKFINAFEAVYKD